jgi:hypothetical protein
MPTKVKMVLSFVGLCNFFKTNIKDFAIVTAPLFMVTRNDSNYKSGTLHPDALKAFHSTQLTLKPFMAFPKSDRIYAHAQLIPLVDWAQVDKSGNHIAI